MTSMLVRLTKLGKQLWFDVFLKEEIGIVTKL